MLGLPKCPPLLRPALEPCELLQFSPQSLELLLSPSSQLLHPFLPDTSLPFSTHPASLPGPGPTSTHVDFHIPSPQPPYLQFGLSAASRALSEDLAVSVAFPCSKAFLGSHCLQKTTRFLHLPFKVPFEWVPGSHSLFTYDFGSTSSPLANQLTWKATTTSSLGSDTASLMKRRAGAPLRQRLRCWDGFLEGGATSFHVCIPAPSRGSTNVTTQSYESESE